MQYGPDNVPVSSQSKLVGPPVKGPAAVPVTTTETILGPLIYDTSSVISETPGNVIVEVPYAVAVEDEGIKVTDKVTSLNFVGADVTATGNSYVTITVTGGSSLTIAGGTSINVSTANNVATVTNTFTETVYSGGSATGNVTPNRNNGTIQKYTLTGNISLLPPTNMSAGQSLTLILTQDSAGSRLLDANVAYLFASGFQTLSTSSGAVDMLNIFSDGSTYYCTLTVDYS